jgi:predicted N-acyltransferase
MDEPMDGFPPWTSWSWHSNYLPKTFHTKEGFRALIKVLKGVPVDNPSYGTMVVGFAWSDMVQPEGEEPIPEWVTESPLGPKHQALLLEAYPQFKFADLPSAEEQTAAK